MTTKLKFNFIFEPNIETFYLDLINAMFDKCFVTLEQIDNFLDGFITQKILNERREELCPKTSTN